MSNNIKTCKRCYEEKECPYGKYYCRECQALFCKEYKARNREKIAEYNKKYKEENKEIISQYNHKYNNENREAIQNRQREQHKERRAKDYNYKRSIYLRKCIYDLIKNIKKKLKHLSCTRDFFIKWLEFNFQNDMKLDNYGTLWCIDHVLPCCNFNFEDNIEEEYKCFHWTNLRPLYKKDNLKRGKKVTEEEISLHEQKIKDFIEKNKEETIHLIHFDKLKYINKQ
jgi:hypothetical protein